MINKLEILIPDATYHIYNRANGNEKLFLNDENYSYFLRKYIEYISPIAHTFCYCLMPNHFHFLIQIKSENELLAFLKAEQNKDLQGKRKDLTGFENLSGLFVEKLISSQFSSFFNSYAKAFNKQHGRTGSLFMRPYKRKRVNESTYFSKLVHYIHYNPLEADLCQKIDQWKYSSYNQIISNEATFLNREELINWFNDLDNFKFIHQYPPKETGIEKIVSNET